MDIFNAQKVREMSRFGEISRLQMASFRKRFEN